MKDKSNDNMMKAGVVCLASFAAFMFAGPKETAKNQPNNVDKIPALQQEVSGKTNDITPIKSHISNMRESQRIDYSSLRESLGEMQRIQAHQLDRVNRCSTSCGSDQ